MAMVIPALKYQTSPEQRKAWLPLATSFRILGAYVQTELGHGSNVRALETTATFDKVFIQQQKGPGRRDGVVTCPAVLGNCFFLLLSAGGFVCCVCFLCWWAEVFFFRRVSIVFRTRW